MKSGIQRVTPSTLYEEYPSFAGGCPFSTRTARTAAHPPPIFLSIRNPSPIFDSRSKALSETDIFKSLIRYTPPYPLSVCIIPPCCISANP